MTTDDVLSRFAPFPLRAQLFNGDRISADSCGTWTAEVREENLAAYAAEILGGTQFGGWKRKDLLHAGRSGRRYSWLR
jgi:hypothetical protein